jgi:hypothetical protein
MTALGEKVCQFIERCCLIPKQLMQLKSEGQKHVKRLQKSMQVGRNERHIERNGSRHRYTKIDHNAADPLFF